MTSLTLDTNSPNPTDKLGLGLSPGDAHYRAYVGPPEDYDLVAAMCFGLLTSLGLRGRHCLLDVGCGSLRLGRLLIPYLNAAHYYGLEPNQWLVDEGLAQELGASIVPLKEPQFYFGDSSQLIGKTDFFDFAIAQSIFSHCGLDLLTKHLTEIHSALAPGGALLAQAATGLRTPWRVLAIGSLATIMDSTLGTDLAAPAIAFDTAKVLPGHAAWSWGLLKDDATVYGVQKDFIDYAADMRWNYVLVDADWDRKIGYEKIAELASYAAAKDVGLFLWYNSSGSWNKTEYTPKDKLLTHAQREHEFSRLAAMGIKGIKVEFFAGDGQSMIADYLGILNDAARHGLLVNFHGATLPRGWARTYPNLMTAEAVKGLEFTTFEQCDQDAMPAHAAMLPFARNLFDPMDFTPMVFGDVPNIRRATRNGFELALPVLFLSGVQNFAEIPAGMASVPPYVKTFLQELPRSWDDSRFIDGVPGRYLMLARQSGERWYVAGINAQVTAQTFTVDLSFLEGKRGALITDGAGERAFSQQEISAGKAVITIKPHGGFVAIFN